MTGRHSPSRPVVDGKFIATGGERFLIKGVTYGTFAPGQADVPFPPAAVVKQDFAQMRAAGVNTVRTYTPPSLDLLDQAMQQGLRVMIGLPWSQHVTFLDDPQLCRQIRREVVASARELATHPGVLLLAIGNEIPAPVVRWHGPNRVQQFLYELYEETKATAPDALVTYVNYPPTEYLSLPFLDVFAFNVYLHLEADLRRYLARLQHIAGHKPLVLAEAGADSIREGQDGQAAITAMQLSTAFSEGTAGAVAFAWTDEWWRGGHPVEDWAFGLVDNRRQPKPALSAVTQVFAEAPFPPLQQQGWPRITVVVCAYNEASTIDECLTSLDALSYPNYEIILINDGSHDATGEIARQHSAVRVIDVPNGGLSAARNIGLEHATGTIVAYTDGDGRADPDWLTYLVQPFLKSNVVGVGGPNVVPPDDPPVAQCIARAPGSPTHVLLDDRIAEHVPGCNMAFKREALLSIGGFNPIYLRAGDDIDICWRLQARGWNIGFAPAALVWHHHRSTVRGYWKQQVGYGEGEAWLKPHHPDRFKGLHIGWHGRIYGPLPFHRALSRRRVNSGTWGTASFPSVYDTDAAPLTFMPHSMRWQVCAIALVLLGTLPAAQPWLTTALSLLGLAALGVTVARCLRYALATDIEGLSAACPGPRWLSQLAYRAGIAALYLIQPLARAWGRLRGSLSPPQVEPTRRVQNSAATQTRQAYRDTIRYLTLRSTERRLWSERWISAESLLTPLVKHLQNSRTLGTIEVDDGWRADRDIRIAVGLWAWLDLRMVAEDHGASRCLVRIASRLHPGLFLLMSGAALALGVAGGLAVLPMAGWPLLAASAIVFALTTATRFLWRLTRVIAAVEKALKATTAEAALLPLPAHPTTSPDSADTPDMAASASRQATARTADSATTARVRTLVGNSPPDATHSESTRSPT